ncbi:MAG: thioredoxin family protein [Aquihabitans sp.]
MNKPSGPRGWFRRGRVTTDGSTAGVDTAADHGASKPGDAASGVDPSDEDSHVEIIELDDISFDKGTEGGATVVDFWAAWCRPCAVLQPIYQHAADDHEGPVRFARCDIEASPEVAGMVGIQSIPTVALFDVDGNEVERLSGVPSRKDLDRLIARGAALVDDA